MIRLESSWRTPKRSWNGYRRFSPRGWFPNRRWKRPKTSTPRHGGGLKPLKNCWVEGDTVGDGEVRVAEARYRATRARLAALEKAGPNRGRVKAAQGQIRQAEADLDRAQYNLRQTTLEAPIFGIVTEVMVQLGEKVHEGKPVVRIADIARVKLKADLSPGLLPYVHIGQKAKVTENTVPPTDLRASVDRIQPVADPKTQSLGLTLFLLNPTFKFQPGFTAQVEIPVGRGPLKAQ